MAYDRKTKRTVLFGGFDPKGGSDKCVLNDTWVWNAKNSKWTNVTPPKKEDSPEDSPPARYGHTMAFANDATGVVLFGGYTGLEDLGDTWIWEGKIDDQGNDLPGKWTQWKPPEPPTPDNTPSPRARAAMAFDEERNEAVLFGGDHEQQLLGDTWVWKGGGWVSLEPEDSPSPRGYSAMAYAPNKEDPEGHEVILVSGWNQNVLVDTWAWTGSNWELRTSPDEGDSRDTNFMLSMAGAMAYHRATGMAVAQPGHSWYRDLAERGVERTTDLSTLASHDPGVWDGQKWASHPNALAPPSRSFPAMAEDSEGHVVFFGGSSIEEADTFADATWTLMTPIAVTLPTTPPTPEVNRVTLTINKTEIDADGLATATATATATYGDVPRSGARVSFSTDGDLTFDPPSGETRDDGTFHTTIIASKTPGENIVTVSSETLAPNDIGPKPQASATLLEAGMTLSLAPASIPADGSSTSLATATLYKENLEGKLAGEKVCFSTSGKVAFSPPCGERTGDSWSTTTWSTTITSSPFPAVETITATARESRTAQDTPISASAQLFVGTGQWVQQSVPGPGPTPAREHAAMAYDEASGVTVVFGGGIPPYGGRCREGSPEYSCQGESYDVLGDTWVWEDSKWTPVPTPPGGSSPTARVGASMAYDAGSRRLLLFGGYTAAGYSDETWLFNADPKVRTWTPVLTPEGKFIPGPSARYVANMASDGKGVVLFSGTNGWAADSNSYTDDDGPTDPRGPGHLRDTWIWRHGEGWTDVTPKTVQKEEEKEEAASWKTFINSDGKPTDGQPSRTIDVPLPPPPPECLRGAPCPADKADPYPSKIAVSGLDPDSEVAEVTVTLHELSWTRRGPADADIMVVAPDGRAVMLMSDACGVDHPNWARDKPSPIYPEQAITLTFDDTAPAELPAGPCHDNDQVQYTTGATFRPTDVESSEFGTRNPDGFPGATPASTGSHSLGDFTGMPASVANDTWSLYVVDDYPDHPSATAVAGRINGGWTLNIRTEDEIPPAPPASVLAPSPPSRGRAAMAYLPRPPEDPQKKGTGKVVLYGGTQEFRLTSNSGHPPHHGGYPFHPLGDTWTWDPDTMTWAQEGAGSHPGARRSAAMAYHPGTAQLVLFGGSSTRHGRVADPKGCPEGWGLQRPECRGAVTPLDDTWTWDGAAWARQSPSVTPQAGHVAGMARDFQGRLVLLGSAGSPSGSTWTFESKVAMRVEAPFLVAQEEGSSAAPGTTTAVVKVTDSKGQGVRDLTVDFSTDGGVTFAPATATTGLDGTATTTVTASRDGEWGIETLTVNTPLGSASATLNEVAATVCRPDPVNAVEPVTGADEPDKLAGSWSEPEKMPTARQGLAAATGGDGFIYTFGGSTDMGDIVEAYDPCTERWTPLPPMPSGRRARAAAAAGPDGRIYVVGGAIEGVFEMGLHRADVYIPATPTSAGRWETLPDLPDPMSQAGASVDHDGKLFVTGGTYWLGGHFYPSFATVVVYSPLTGKWTPSPPMSSARYGHGQATMPDGRTLVTGGSVTQSSSGEVAEAYNAKTGKWEPIAPNDSEELTTGHDGLVYATGSVAEAYVPCIDDWVPVAPPNIPRASHASVTGPDGRIYVLGGSGRSPAGVAGDSFEVYTPDPRTKENLCPKVSINDAPPVDEPPSADAPPNPARFTVSLDRPPAKPVTVHYKTVNGTASVEDGDYQTTSGTLTFDVGETTKTVEPPPTTAPSTTLPGAPPVADLTQAVEPPAPPPPPDPSQTPLSKTIHVPVLGDNVPEREDETFTVELSVPPHMATIAKDRGTGRGTIRDTTPGVDPEPALGSVGVTGPEPVMEPADPGDTARATFKLSRSDASGPASVHFRTEDRAGPDGATAGEDYERTEVAVRFTANETDKTVDVDVRHDTATEGPERFFVVLSEPDGVDIDRARFEAVATILDRGGDDAGLPTVSVTGAPTVTEPAVGETAVATFPVTLNARSTQPVHLDYTVAGVTATARDDFDDTSVPLNFAAGQTNAFITVPVLRDSLVEDPETFTVTLSKPTNATLGEAQATGTIVDRPPPVHRYECTGATGVTTTSATLEALSTDPAVNTVTFTLSRQGTVVDTKADDGPPFAAPVDRLSPDTDYDYSVVFGPGPHAQTGAPCRFHTLATAPTTTAGPAVTTTTSPATTTTTTPATTTTSTSSTTTSTSSTTSSTSTTSTSTSTSTTSTSTTSTSTTSTSTTSTSTTSTTVPPPPPPPPPDEPSRLAPPPPPFLNPPPPPAFLQPFVQPGAQAQAVSQAVAQAQAAAQASGQAQGSTQSQIQQQTQRQTQTQVQPGGATSEREREAQVQIETVEGDQTYLASSRRRSPVPAPAMAWAAAAAAGALGLAISRRGDTRPSAALVRSSRRRRR